MKFPQRLQDLVPPDAVKQLVDLVAQPALVSGIKDAAHKLGWKESWNPTQLQEVMQQAKRWVESVAERFQPGPSDLRNGINATGEIFSSRFWATPLSAECIRAQAMVQEGFVAGKLTRSFESTFATLTGAERVLAVRSLPLAIQLLARVPQPSKGWLLPRSDCIRLPRHSWSEQSLDLRELLETLATPIKEIGASNECNEADIEGPMREGWKSILCVEQADATGKNFFQRETLRKATHRHDGILCEVLLHGSLFEIPGLSPQPTLIRDRMASGVDLAIVPCDGWIGGPPVALLIGKASLLDPLESWATKLGFDLSPSEVAVLNARVDQCQELASWQQSSIGLLMSVSKENLQNRAQRMATQLRGAEGISAVDVAEKPFAIGDGLWSPFQMESAVVTLHPSISASSITERLASLPRPIHVRREGEALHLVLRTVDPSEDASIVDAFRPASAD